MRNRILALLLIAAMALAILPLTALRTSADTYALSVAGVRVTDENKADVLGDGVFSYDQKTNKLTVSGDCSYKGRLIDNRIPGLTITAAKDAELRVTGSGAAIYTAGDLTVTGPGKLTLSSAENGGWIYVASGAALNIDSADIEVSGGYGFMGDKTFSKPGGVITAVSNGKATITATAPSGASASCAVTVEGFGGAPERITAVNVDGFLVPGVGESASDYLDLSVADDAPYTISDAYWGSLSLESPMKKTEIFEEGDKYYLVVWLEPKNGYYFDSTNKPTAALNGLTSNVDTPFIMVASNGNLAFFSVNVTPETAHVLYGDVNSDGVVNKKDSLALKKYLADNTQTIDLSAADVNADGAVNKKDSLRLKQYLAGWAVTLGA